MSKLIPILALAIIMLSALTACGQSTTSTSATTPPATSTAASTTSPAASTWSNTEQDPEIARLLDGKTIAAVYRVQDLENYKSYFQRRYQITLKDFVLVDSLTDALLQLNSGKADVLELMDFTGDYLVQRNSGLAMVELNSSVSSTHMLFSQNRQSLYEKINATLKTMQEDGTIDSLVTEWITDLPAGDEPAGQTMPVFEGAETIKMGISGDEPPLDYIAADGVPGGFNVAVLAEISRRSGINIELVSVTGGGRFTALQSGKIDAFLWHNAFITSKKPAPTNPLTLGDQTFLISEPYLESQGCYVYKQ